MTATILGKPLAEVLELEAQGFRSKEARRRAVVDMLGHHISLVRYLQALYAALDQHELEMRQIDAITTGRLMREKVQVHPLRARIESGR